MRTIPTRAVHPWPIEHPDVAAAWAEWEQTLPEDVQKELRRGSPRQFYHGEMQDPHFQPPHVVGGEPSDAVRQPRYLTAEQSGPVTVRKPDGTVETRPAYTDAEVRKIVTDGEREARKPEHRTALRRYWADARAEQETMEKAWLRNHQAGEAPSSISGTTPPRKKHRARDVGREEDGNLYAKTEPRTDDEVALSAGMEVLLEQVQADGLLTEKQWATVQLVHFGWITRREAARQLGVHHSVVQEALTGSYDKLRAAARKIPKAG